ncbi:FAD-binding and (Fe-S)-binding domain-containing protein [Desertibaculum subflavum]|uniref:FAD-binding and (Fe-S)-binding domain-containing protein n=1 Tax=Desertibaculum subflavum TaxID=2268458 RepID=UPI000E662F7B
MAIATTARTRLQARLERELRGAVMFDAASRGRYATDASIYQIEPIGVVVPVDQADAAAALAIAIDEGAPVLPRGAGTSQCGQTVGEAVVIDLSRHVNKIVAFDRSQATVTVEPGIVLDKLNAFLRPHGLWFPVDVSTSAQATIGGMAGNNSCGSRSIRYGNMVHNVLGIDATLADGTEAYFGQIDGNLSNLSGPSRLLDIAGRVRAIAAREAAEIEARYPKLLRRVGGYNLETVRPEGHNLAHLLVGSEGTLAFSRQLHLKLAPLPKHRTLGVCHFPTFYQAMDLTRHIVTLGPTAVELVDRTMIELARGNPAFAGTVAKFLKGEPDAILLVEFAGEDPAEQLGKLKDLVVLLGDLGLPGGVVEVTDATLQRDIWEVRKAGLNIMMSMKGDGKPVSFIEDCAVPLEHLAEYTARLTRVFEKHGTRGTWYAHASVGTLHVRPILNMKTEDGPRQMRAIAEEAAAMVREYKGAYSGEHGDGLVRSEWIAPFFGPRLTSAFEEIKDLFDPKGLMNPGKIVRPSKMDDRALFRFSERYRPEPVRPALDWPDAGGFLGAVEMCNNNGHCRKFDAGTMCPSWRVTGNERDLTRGRANTLRLALSGQLGPDALTSDAMYETMSLCVGCKGCKRECPTGVDMARMKTEFLYHYRQRRGLRPFDRLVAYLPRYARYASRLGGLLALRDKVPGLAALSEKLAGFARQRPLPRWSRRPFRAVADGAASADVVLLADTFNTWFEPENVEAALAVLRIAGYRVHVVGGAGGRPLCCGRTFLAAGLVDEARAEATRLTDALAPYVARALPILGLEPSCLFTLRDELQALLPGPAARELGRRALLFEEFLAAELAAGRCTLPLVALAQKRALIHGHCHQKAFDTVQPTVALLKAIPELQVEVIETSCCGMAGAFGYEAANYDMSMQMGELALLPRIRASDAETLLVADGTSCRHQIADGTGREAQHIAQVLLKALR